MGSSVSAVDNSYLLQKQQTKPIEVKEKVEQGKLFQNYNYPNNISKEDMETIFHELDDQIDKLVIIQQNIRTEENKEKSAVVVAVNDAYDGDKDDDDDDNKEIAEGIVASFIKMTDTEVPVYNNLSELLGFMKQKIKGHFITENHKAQKIDKIQSFDFADKIQDIVDRSKFKEWMDNHGVRRLEAPLAIVMEVTYIDGSFYATYYRIHGDQQIQHKLFSKANTLFNTQTTRMKDMMEWLKGKLDAQSTNYADNILRKKLARITKDLQQRRVTRCTKLFI